MMHRVGGAGKLQVFVWSEMLALFADARYNRDFSDLAAHLTNTCRQSSADGSASEAFRERNAVKLLSELPKVLALVNLPDPVCLA